MRHFTSPSFWECYGKLPVEIKELADKNYELLKENPKHPSFLLKREGCEDFLAPLFCFHRAWVRSTHSNLTGFPARSLKKIEADFNEIYISEKEPKKKIQILVEEFMGIESN